MISKEFVALCIALANHSSQGSTFSPTDIDFSFQDDLASSMSLWSSALDSVPKEEAMFYYAGLPSSPQLVYHSSTKPWVMPTGPEAYRIRKELRPVFDHKLASVWDDLGPKVCELLDANSLIWTSIHVVRFKAGTDPVGPVILWVGVDAETVSGDIAHTCADGCLALLQEVGIDDVEVEFRSSIYTRSAGPGLLKPVSDLHPTVDVRGPLTAALGLSIAATATLDAEGTGGLYLAQGGGSDNVFLLTARHVLFPSTMDTNQDYPCPRTSAALRYVALMGSQAFDNLLVSIKCRVGRHGIIIELYERQIETLKKRVAGEGEDKDKDEMGEARKELEKKQLLLKETIEAIEALEKFYHEVKWDWSNPKRRIIGHVVCSPRITVNAGAEGFTEDFALVALNTAKFKKAFKGNVIDLGTEIPADKFTEMMYPHHDSHPHFKYPEDCLLRLQGTIPEDLMRSPDMVDCNGKKCLFVIKRGITTGVTIGRANGIFSYVREYFPNQTHQTSKEWAILPYDNKSGQFSDCGDSGSIIIDGLGRIGGLLTGGGGKTASSDVTYATPFYWLLTRLKMRGFPNAHVGLQIA